MPITVLLITVDHTGDDVAWNLILIYVKPLCYFFFASILVPSNDCMTDLNSLTQYFREQEEEQERLQRGKVQSMFERRGSSIRLATLFAENRAWSSSVVERKGKERNFILSVWSF